MNFYIEQVRNIDKQALISSFTSGNEFSDGLTCGVYNILGHDDFVLRVSKRMERKGEDAFVKSLEQSELQIQPDLVEGRNFGQTIGYYGYDVDICRKVRGYNIKLKTTMSLKTEEDVKRAQQENWKKVLNLYTAPDSTYEQYISDMNFLYLNYLKIDTGTSKNFIFMQENNPPRICPIDMESTQDATSYNTAIDAAYGLVGNTLFIELQFKYLKTGLGNRFKKLGIRHSAFFDNPNGWHMLVGICDRTMIAAEKVGHSGNIDKTKPTFEYRILKESGANSVDTTKIKDNGHRRTREFMEYAKAPRTRD